MKISLDAMHLAILAALGLGCAARPASGGEAGSSDTGNEDGDSGNEDPETGSADAGTSSTGDGDGDSGDGDGDSGDGDGDGDSGDGDGDGDGEPQPWEGCDNPEPILQLGTDIPSGFVSCDGFIHRAEQVECVDPQGPDSEFCAGDELAECQTAADCVAQDYGRCIDRPWGGCHCDYGCASDADCAEGFVCACAGVVGDHATCIAAACTVDADCGEGLCGLSVYEGCCDVSYELACADPDEACHVDSECPYAPCDPEFPQGGAAQWECAVQDENAPETGDWTCKPPGWCNCDCGRPFLVAGEVRVARTIARSDWALEGAFEGAFEGATGPTQRSLDVDTRRRLSAHWAEIASFEHASVASFARFVTQLLQLGAPPQLVRDSQAALTDEIEHARLAFALATAYAHAPIGPAGLDVDAALDASDALAIVEGLIVEACVGETLAALEAREAALQAEDPVVVAVLEQIAEDEWRHAQLGWRALGWMLRRADRNLHTFALATLERALGAVGAAQELAPASEGLRRHGVLDAALRDEVRRAGIEALVRPCVAALRRQLGSTTYPAGTITRGS